MTTINGIMTGVLLLVFLGICAWAYSSRNQDKFDQMSKLPLEDEVFEADKTEHKEGSNE